MTKIIKINWNLVKKARLWKKMSRQELADKLNISRQQVYNIETDKNNTTEDILVRLVKILNLPIIKYWFVTKPLKPFTLEQFILWGK